MDFDEERDFADQGPLSDMDMEEDAQILATLLKHIPTCTNTADIEQLLQDIPDRDQRTSVTRALSMDISITASV